MSKIFIDCYVFEGEFQGTRTFIKEVYSKIFEKESNTKKALQNQYYLVSNNPEYVAKEFKEYDFVYFINCNCKSRFIRLLFKYPYIILKYKIDYAHFQYVVPPFKFCKYLVTIHDVLFCEYKKYFTLRYRLRNYISFLISYLLSDFITTVSIYSKNSILKYFKFYKPISITPNGVNEYFYNFNSTLSKSDFLIKNGYRDYFLYVSRFEPRKNHINLLKAYIHGGSYLKYDLILIGSKTLDCVDFFSYYNELDISIQNRIHLLHEGVNNELLLQYYYFTTIFIYPSLLEGFGIPPLEASAMGIPVICSNLTAMQDFTFYNEFHINPTINNIAEKIDLILNTNKVYVKDIVAFKYNWDISANIFFDTYNKNLMI
jgi:glycosyltransferase involved in cell wall biosynthesis